MGIMVYSTSMGHAGFNIINRITLPLNPKPLDSLPTLGSLLRWKKALKTKNPKP